MDEKIAAKTHRKSSESRLGEILKADGSCISNRNLEIVNWTVGDAKSFNPLSSNFGFEMQESSDFQFPFCRACGVQFLHVFQGGFDESSIEIWFSGGTGACRISSVRATECAASSEGIR